MLFAEILSFLCLLITLWLLKLLLTILSLIVLWILRTNSYIKWSRFSTLVTWLNLSNFGLNWLQLKSVNLDKEFKALKGSSKLFLFWISFLEKVKVIPAKDSLFKESPAAFKSILNLLNLFWFMFCQLEKSKVRLMTSTRWFT